MLNLFYVFQLKSGRFAANPDLIKNKRNEKVFYFQDFIQLKFEFH